MKTTLEILGWQPFFAQQVSANELDETPPVRVMEVHRRGLHVLGENIDTQIPSGVDATIGDWLLLNSSEPVLSRVLDRKSLIKRRAPGTHVKVQLIAANIDTAFIVSSCNQDFNVARLERYIAMALEAAVTPVIVLTKTDLCDNPDQYIEEAQTISASVPVVVLDARGDEPKSKLAKWSGLGQTVGFLGSSGVGKSTLVNALSETPDIATQTIREKDDKGKHTTTSRQIHIVANGCAVMDTPGMRELQLIDASSGVNDLFSDIHDLTMQCRFNDCQHQTEPGCAIVAAVETGTIDSARLKRWEKLVAEERENNTSIAGKKSGDKSIEKKSRAIKKENKNNQRNR
jgi:ribosome biogenesis GTPase / thiamine phosphate phosphatase